MLYDYAVKHDILVDHDDLFYTQQTSIDIIKNLLSEQSHLNLVLLEVGELKQKINHFYKKNKRDKKEINLEQMQSSLLTASDTPLSKHDLLANHADAPVINFINDILNQAINAKASDIHFDTHENKLIVRMRIDGMLHRITEITREIGLAAISRLKIMSKLDIAEKRLPQDGRIKVNIAEHSVDLRVSTLPTNYGERLVIRILDQSAVNLDLNQLGMSSTDLEKIKTVINKPHGIVLVTGPTGSGKTTSLYAALRQLDHTQRNIMTVEDPIEYDLSGISQTPINADIGLDFANSLRSILRQDPDVIMIGEIRDRETAQIAIQASMTGHLVFSTLHTNTAIGAVTRLYDIGVEPFLLASSLNAVIAQRLVRQLCENCKQAIKPNDLIKQSFNLKNQTIYQPVGCEHCLNSGYKGRIGLYQVIDVDKQLRDLMYAKHDENSLQTYIKQHCSSLFEDGLEKAYQGLTSLEEVMRVANPTQVEVG